MRKSIFAIAAAGMMTVAAVSGFSASAAGTPSANASCMGIERATRNSNGGDRDHGGFGPVQSDFVQQNQPYGQWLEEAGWKDKGNCPG